LLANVTHEATGCGINVLRDPVPLDVRQHPEPTDERERPISKRGDDVVQAVDDPSQRAVGVQEDAEITRHRKPRWGGPAIA
jgi:hypothetical protein